MSKLFNWAAARLVAAFALALPLATWAVANEMDKDNPVTGETETYGNAFSVETSEPLEWNSADNWTLAEEGKVPFVSGGNYSPALVDGKTVTTATQIDGWTLRVGAYNGASVTWSGGISKIQASTVGCWLTAADTSKITIASFGGAQLEGSGTAPFKLTSENAGGITWSAGLTSSSNTSLPFWYYLKGAGTVVYGGDITVDNAQVIKMADITLSGTSQVTNKTLVTFGSGTTKVFTADATIKRLDSTDTDLNDDALIATVNTTGTTTLTTSDAVGKCELVQTSTGIELYWVDGDPAALMPTVYKPSISINFTNGAGNGLTTAADVGLAGYEVPGTSWNNFVVANNSTFSTVNAVDSTGTASVLSGVSVTISGTRGSHSCSALTPATNPLHGYIDENGDNSTPTVTVSGIPYYKYRVVVYHSTDTKNVPFGFDTINGTNYTYVNDALSEGTTAWGNSGALNSADAIAEGSAEAGNVLVTEALSGSALTVVGHRAGGANNARGCIAAIQIIEVKPDVGENDLEIAVDGDTNYTVSEAQNLSGTVYLTGSGTLTLDGSAKISASTIDVGLNVTLNINADRLDATTFTGAGTVVYDGSQPDTTKGFDNSAWTGTVWVKNIGDTSRGEATDSKVNTCLGSNTADASSNDLNKWGNANSFVKFTNVRAYMAAANVPWTLILEDDSTNYAWYNNEGWTARTITIAGLKGNGTFWDINDGGCRPFLNFTDASQFSGSIKALGKQVFLNGAGTGNASDLLSGRIVVPADQVLTVSAGETWHTRNGLVVNGTLSVNGTLGSESTSSAVSGAGTVVFTGRAPTVSGDAWWKNAGWTGTVQIDNITDLVGTSDWGSGTYLDFNSYGNANSVIKLGNITGWLAGETCNVPVNLAGTLTINNGFSGSAFTFKKLISNGGYITATDQTATARIVIEDGSEYAGYIGLNAKMVVFGTDNPEFVKGQVYVSSDAAITVPAVNTAYWAVGNIVVAGELKADSLSRFGGGTHINTTGDGVFTLTSTGNGQETETDTDYARISGTDGSLKYEGTGWRALSTNNFPTAVTLVNEQAGDILLSRALTYTVGSLAGSKNFQGNYGSGNRYLNVIQSKDTEWSGKVVNDNSSRFAGLKLDASSTGTLKLSGTASQNVALEVNGGAVNLTGTWKGATTVAGTLGGTGTLTGDLTFSDGATFKAFGTDSDGLAVSGTITYPGTGTVTVDFAEVPTADTVLLSASGLDASKFTLAAGVPGGSLAVENNALVYKSPFVTITVPAVANATASVTVGGEPVPPITEGGNSYYVIEGSAVTVTYSANDGYELSGTATYTIESAAEGSTITITDTQTAAYVATLYTATTTKYTTLQAAVTAAADVRNSKLVLLASTESESATIPAVDSAKFYVVTNVYECGTINYPAGDYIVATTSETIDISGVGEDLAATVYSATKAAVAVTVSGGERTLYDGSSIVIAVSTAIAGGLGSTVEFVNGTDSAPYVSTLQAAGFTVENEVWTFTTLPVAKVTHGIGETSYLTLSDAFANAQSGDTITVLADNALTNTIEITTNNLTLDLNGHTVTGAEGDHFMFELKAAVGFTIKDTSTGQTGKAYSAASKVVLANGQDCSFTLTSGTLESGNSVPVYIYGDSSHTYSVTISGGTLKSSRVSNPYDSSSAADYCIVATEGTITFTGDSTIYSTVGAFRAKTVNVSGGSVTVGDGRTVCYSTSGVNFTYNFTGGTFNKDVNTYCAAGYAAYEETPDWWTVSEVYVDGQEVCLNGTNVTINANQATWLKACGGKTTVSNALEDLTFEQFSNAYLLNLDILNENYQDYQEGDFVVTDFAFETENETEYVVVEVTLERHGALDGGINGTLKLTGTADLGVDFVDISETPVDDDDFSDGDIATWRFIKGDKKFFKPVIE